MNVATVTMKNEPPALLRWVVLAVVSFAMFGNYYIYDSISPLADLLVKQLNFTDADIGLLQGIYSIPNIIMVLIGGFIIDRIGTKKASLIFSSLCLIGSYITVLDGNLTLMATGRLIFGLGAESLIVSITTIIARWFKGKELSFAFGLNLTIARLGSWLALNSPSWGKSYYEYWQDPLYIAFGAGIISVLTVIIYFAIDFASERKYTLQKEGEQDKVVFSDIFKFNKSFWFITLLCVTFYSAMFPFQTFAVKFFQQVHLSQMPEDVARGMGGFLSSLLTLSAMILTPLFGLMADKVGKRASLMMLGSFLIMPVYLIMNYVIVDVVIPQDVISIFTESDSGSGGILQSFAYQFIYFGNMIKVLFAYYPNIVLPMITMGIAFSLIPAIMWPSVALVVDNSKLGTAYGLMTMIQNIGLAGFNVLIGSLHDFTNSYTAGMWVFSSLGIIGLLFAYILKKNELSKGVPNLESAKK